MKIVQPHPTTYQAHKASIKYSLEPKTFATIFYPSPRQPRSSDTCLSHFKDFILDIEGFIPVIEEWVHCALTLNSSISKETLSQKRNQPPQLQLKLQAKLFLKNVVRCCYVVLYWRNQTIKNLHICDYLNLELSLLKLLCGTLSMAVSSKFAKLHMLHDHDTKSITSTTSSSLS